jgi:tRNA threonylcarbamoyladenosine biosynthesis protein TsaB
VKPLVLPPPVLAPLVLAIDTTHEFGSLALASGDDLVEEVLLHAPAGFGQVLYTHLDQLLARHGVTTAMVDCFAAASGPGSFTGVRIGLACIKGLAEAAGKPASAVGNLEAMAAFGTAPLRAVVMDARRGEVYGAVYDTAGRVVSPEVVAPFPAWLASLPASLPLSPPDSLPDAMEFVSTDFTPFRASLAGTRFQDASVVTAPRALAAAMARIAAARWLRGEACDPAALDANYVRRPDAELLWKE